MSPQPVTQNRRDRDSLGRRHHVPGEHRYLILGEIGTDAVLAVVADPSRARAFHLNRYGLYAWSADGVLRARMSTTEKPFKPLVHFALLECTPAGELLLAHRRQRLLLRVPVPQDLDDLAVAVEAALKGYGRERTALKKQYAPVNWLWSDSVATVNHL